MPPRSLALVRMSARARARTYVEYGPLRVRGLDVGGIAELMRRLA
jgi:hypothetical protein